MACQHLFETRLVLLKIHSYILSLQEYIILLVRRSNLFLKIIYLAYASYTILYTNMITFECRKIDASFKDIYLCVGPTKEITDTTRRGNRRLARHMTELKYNQEEQRIKFE